MKKILLLLTFLCPLGLTSLAATDWDKIAVITGSQINIREKPSATSRPLGHYPSDAGGDADCCPEYIWKPTSQRKGGFVNEKLYEGLALPCLGSQGDWINVVFGGKSAWIMAKYAEIRDVVPLSPRMDINDLGIMEDGRAVFKEETVCGSFIFFGRLVGGKVVFDRFIDGQIAYDPSISTQKAEEVYEGYFSFTVGRAWDATSNGFWPVMSTITPDKYDWLYGYSRPIQGKQVWLTGTPDGGYVNRHELEF